MRTPMTDVLREVFEAGADPDVEISDVDDYLNSATRRLAATLADLMDDATDSDGQWNGSDVCEYLAEFIDHHGGWAQCPSHGGYSAAKPTCPLDHDDEEDA